MDGPHLGGALRGQRYREAAAVPLHSSVWTVAVMRPPWTTVLCWNIASLELFVGRDKEAADVDVHGVMQHAAGGELCPGYKQTNKNLRAYNLRASGRGEDPVNM